MMTHKISRFIKMLAYVPKSIGQNTHDTISLGAEN